MSEDIRNPLICLAILNGLREGKSVPAIAAEAGIGESSIYRHIKAMAEEARRTNRERVAEAQMTADARLEWLYSKCADVLRVCFDKDALRLAILVLERQSKLLGLDKGGTNLGKAQRDWLTDAPDSELIREAKRLNIPLPEKFLTGEPLPA